VYYFRAGLYDPDSAMYGPLVKKQMGARAAPRFSPPDRRMA
jgi:hypothetical protein